MIKNTIKNKIFVYKNLHKGNYSLRQNGKVFDRASCVLLEDVVFKVSENRRQAVIRQKRKNVHAGPLGMRYTTDPYKILADLIQTNPSKEIVQIYYNPYQTDSFVVKNDMSKKLSGAEMVILTPLGVWAVGPKLK